MLNSPTVDKWTYLHFPTMLTLRLLKLLCRECVLSAIQDDAVAPYFKCLNLRALYVLCDVTHVHHCVTRCIRLLVLMLSKPCAIIMFGIQLV